MLCELRETIVWLELITCYLAMESRFWLYYMVAYVTAGRQTLRFSSITEFFQWKDHEEEHTYTTYVKGEQIHYPTSNNRVGNYAHS